MPAWPSTTFMLSSKYPSSISMAPCLPFGYPSKHEGHCHSLWHSLIVCSMLLMDQAPLSFDAYPLSWCWHWQLACQFLKNATIVRAKRKANKNGLVSRAHVPPLVMMISATQLWVWENWSLIELWLDPWFILWPYCTATGVSSPNSAWPGPGCSNSDLLDMCLFKTRHYKQYLSHVSNTLLNWRVVN